MTERKALPSESCVISELGMNFNLSGDCPEVGRTGRDYVPHRPGG